MWKILDNALKLYLQQTDVLKKIGIKIIMFT